MTTTNPGQTQPNQVPDHRLEEMAEKLRNLELQNAQLRTLVDRTVKPPPTPTKKDSVFKPEVEQSIREVVQEMLKETVNPLQENFTRQVGYLHDRADAIDFNQKYGGDKYSKLLPKVEQLRQRYEAEGKWIPREEALRVVFFEETGKKTTPDPVQEPVKKEPVFDPYFGTYVDPDTKMPTQAPVQLTQDDGLDEEKKLFEEFKKSRANQQAPQTYQDRVTANQFNLPGQGVNNPATISRDTRRVDLNLEASDADLAAFEQTFGDVPL